MLIWSIGSLQLSLRPGAYGVSIEKKLSFTSRLFFISRALYENIKQFDHCRPGFSSHGQLFFHDWTLKSGSGLIKNKTQTASGDKHCEFLHFYKLHVQHTFSKVILSDH